MGHDIMIGFHKFFRYLSCSTGIQKFHSQNQPSQKGSKNGDGRQTPGTDATHFHPTISFGKNGMSGAAMREDSQRLGASAKLLFIFLPFYANRFD